MNAIEQRRFCGLMQNKLTEITGEFYSATSTGYCLFCKNDNSKKTGIKHKKITNTNYIVSVNKTELKILGIL